MFYSNSRDCDYGAYNCDDGAYNHDCLPYYCPDFIVADNRDFITYHDYCDAYNLYGAYNRDYGAYSGAYNQDYRAYYCPDDFIVADYNDWRADHGTR